jgi:FAD:protein FMN transferase
MHHVFETMGTVASFEVPGYVKAAALTATIENIFSTAEQRFSLYHDDSELSRINFGTLDLTEASVSLRNAYASAMEWRRLTDGAFSPNRPDGMIDLNGIVKARAMDAAGHAFESAGIGNWSLNIGGDVLCLGSQSGSQPWTIGIVDPVDRAAMLCAVTLEGGRRAVATSGSAERGAHIWLGGSRNSAEFLQVTVTADDIVTADVLATAIMSGGQASLDHFTEKWSIDVLTVDLVGDLRATPGFRTSLAA